MSESWGSGDRKPHRRERNIAGSRSEVRARRLHRYVCDSAIWAINPHLYAKVPIGRSPIRGRQHDLDAPDLPHIHPSVPATNLRGIHRLRRKESREARLPRRRATARFHHITTELFKSLAGIEMVHVPTRNGTGRAGSDRGRRAGRVLQLYRDGAIRQGGKGAHPRERRRQRTPRWRTSRPSPKSAFPGSTWPRCWVLVPAGRAARNIVAKLNAGVVGRRRVA